MQEHKLINYMLSIVQNRLPLPPRFFLKRGGGTGKWILITSQWGGGIWKIKKGGGRMVQGQVFLKDGGRGVEALSLFNFFKVYHFYI